jgi:ketosteroid isomerase-like protein
MIQKIKAEPSENTDAEGKSKKVSIRATSLFRKESGKWKMIGHHTDLLSFAGMSRPEGRG